MRRSDPAREAAILQRMAVGQSDCEIAAELRLAMGTIKWHVHQIGRELHTKSRIQAIEPDN